jgi:hypothetical protein
MMLAGQAHAGEQVLYKPAPDWVAPTPPDTASGAGTPTQRVFDVQKRIDHGLVWTYATTAVRIDTPEGLAKAGTVSLNWAPEHGDLIIHAIHILRGDKVIDVLAGGKQFTVLRREAKLEALQLNGVLTATLSVEGLQVGDVLQTTFSVTDRDPALQGHANTGAPLVPLPAQLGFGRVRMMWSDADKIRWKTYLTDVNPVETAKGGWHELLVTFPVAKQPDQAAQVPGRYNRPALIELSDFAGWADVSKVMEPLYRVDTPTAAIKPGGDLDQEIAKIAAATTDPRKRTALALQLVQDKVRYFAVAMNGGNLVPQTPEATWAMRYGDCKAKTLLLLAVLHKLGIEAEGALANLANGDLVHDRLPSVGAFDHVMVLAHVGARRCGWTARGWARARRIWTMCRPIAGFCPCGRRGRICCRPRPGPARPISEIHYDIDMRGGVGLMAPFHATVKIRGVSPGS